MKINLGELSTTPWKYRSQTLKTDQGSTKLDWINCSDIRTLKTTREWVPVHIAATAGKNLNLFYWEYANLKTVVHQSSIRLRIPKTRESNIQVASKQLYIPQLIETKFCCLLFCTFQCAMYKEENFIYTTQWHQIKAAKMKCYKFIYWKRKYTSSTASRRLPIGNIPKQPKTLASSSSSPKFMTPIRRYILEFTLTE